MKKTVVMIMLLVITAYTAPLHANESALPADANRKLIEDNLLAGLASGNMGLQRSCALMLGNIKSDRAVIPLMEVLHNNSDPCVRIAAAWALCMIGDSRGVYAVKMAVRFDECSKVQTNCAWYYENFVKQGTFAFLQSDTLIFIATSKQETSSKE